VTRLAKIIPPRPSAASNNSFPDTDWQALLAGSLQSTDQLAAHLPVERAAIEQVIARYPMRINPYFLSLVQRHGQPLQRQAVPCAEELLVDDSRPDPLHEAQQSPVNGIIHRYPDRVVFLVSNRCAVYCRFCMRKRQVGQDTPIQWKRLQQGLDYIRATAGIREVILSGGDPLLRTDEQLEWLLANLRAVAHVAIIRIHSRVFATLPQRITPALAAILGRFGPLYVNTHFNHAAEITPQAEHACRLLVEAGIPMGCQTVLLRGVNDSPTVLQHLMRRLVAIRVRPYYLHQMDPVAGTAHFRVPIRQGLALMQSLRGHMSGLCVPQYMIDLPGGGGKVPLLPGYVKETGAKTMQVENYRGERFSYPLN
jgi:lysine 2,3-aminomutase